MRKSLRWFFILPVIALLLICSGVRAQWVSSNGPEGATNTQLYSQFQSVLAVTTSEVYFSSNRGDSWEPYSQGFTDHANNFTCGLMNGAEVLLGTSRRGIYHRQTGDTVWSPLGLPGYYINALGAHGSTLLAGTFGQTFRSTDGGATWVESDSGMTSFTTVQQYLADGQLIWAATDHGIFRSDDDGISWRERSTGLNCTTTRAVGKIGDVLFCGDCQWLYTSSDSGGTWVQKASGPSYYYSIATSSGQIFAGSFGIISMSPDTGKTWTTLTDGLPSDYLSSMTFVGNKLLLGTGYTGVFASTDSGKTWVRSSNGLTSAQSIKIVNAGSSIVAGTAGGLFHSTDEGLSWQFIHPRSVPGIVEGIAYDGQYLCTVVNVTFNTVAVYRSSDMGAHWDSVGAGIDSYSNVFDLKYLAGTFYLGSSHGLFSSIDAGESWSAVNGTPGSTTSRSISGITNALFVGTSRGMFASSDAGLSWEQRNSGISDTNLNCINFSNGMLSAATYNGNTYRSVDSGLSWTPGAYAGSPTSFAQIGSTLFLTTSYGLRRSNDSGSTWLPSSDVLPDSSCYGIIEKNGSLYLATTYRGVWKRPAAEIVLGVADNTVRHLPESFALSQNYPNPFNPATTIRFTLPGVKFVKLAVYDLLGREVAILADETLQPGTYARTWDAAGFSSGMYFCRLTIAGKGENASSQTSVRKMILLK